MVAFPSKDPGPYLKVDMSIGKAVGTSLVQEVDVFDEKAEEGNDNLEGKGFWSAPRQPPHRVGSRAGGNLASRHMPPGTSDVAPECK